MNVDADAPGPDLSLKPGASPLAGRRILVGVSGGIAAYKAVDLVSRLRKVGADVRVLMTPAATRFVAPLTFEAISGQRVLHDMPALAVDHPVEHVAVADEAELLIIAPATAAQLAKLASGQSDDFIGTVALSTTAPILVAPAMESHMWSHPATRNNVSVLRSFGYTVMEPGFGRLASGAVGAGRMPEPPSIVQEAELLLSPRRDLEGRSILITAGRTEEPLDPVRFLTNRSSGRMGYAIAEAATRRGAKVSLVSGPSDETPPPTDEFVRVRTALEMHEACIARADDADVIVAVAAVADYRPKVQSEQKIKKESMGSAGEDVVRLELVRNPDILAELGKKKRPGQFLVGFAAETERHHDHALQKLRKKNLDLICLNDVGRSDIGFSSLHNELHLLAADGSVERLPYAPKTVLADQIWDYIVRLSH